MVLSISCDEIMGWKHCTESWVSAPSGVSQLGQKWDLEVAAVFSIPVYYRVAVCSGWDGDWWLCLKIFIWLKPTYQCIYQTEAQLWNNTMKSRCKEKTFVPVEAPPLNSATLCSVCPSVKFKINRRICWAAKSMAYNTRQTLWELWQEKIRGWKIKKNLKENKSWGWYY